MLGKSEITTILIAASPILELRGALPFALSSGLSLIKSYTLSVIGNMLPVIPLFLFFDYFFKELKKIKFIGSFLNWWFAKIDRKSKLISTYGVLGLIMFVAIPLPTSGAWTGTLAAHLLRFSLSKTFWGVFIGVLIAGILVLLAYQGVIKIFLFYIK